jgi:hypothetical protein
MVNKRTHLDRSTPTDVTRRTMLSLPVVAGGILFLSEPIAAAGIPPALIEENTKASDSLVLYTNLLSDVRRSELARALEGLDRDKAVVSGGLREIVNLGKSLDAKYQSTSPPSTEMLRDLRTLTGRMREIRELADTLDVTRRKLSFIRDFEAKVNSIHSLLLNASDDFSRAKETDPSPRAATLRSAGMQKLDTAISTLKAVSPRELNETTLESPLDRLIVLLLGVRAAVEKESSTRHHASFFGIMDVLRANIKPGSWIQLGVGYAVAFPVLLRNQDRRIREKLLMDGLRLVPGLVPSPLVDTAQQLSALTL